uniref:Ammonium transporter AmtB-like domain-containing protein n=1 Tax=Lotharella oceanica TaxID=641309 RepID=A0A7S2TI06_9EUKA
MAASTSVLSMTLVAYLIQGHFSLFDVLNSALAGLVTITAGCATMHVWGAFVAGLISGLVLKLSSMAFAKLRVDDPVDAISVHGVCGMLGLILPAFFSDQELIDRAYGKGHINFQVGHQFSVQLQGLLAIIGFSMGTVLLILLPFKLFHPNGVRVTDKEELVGNDYGYFGSYAYPDWEEMVRDALIAKERKKELRRRKRREEHEKKMMQRSLSQRMLMFSPFRKSSAPNSPAARGKDGKCTLITVEGDRTLQKGYSGGLFDQALEREPAIARELKKIETTIARLKKLVNPVKHSPRQGYPTPSPTPSVGFMDSSLDGSMKKPPMEGLVPKTYAAMDQTMEGSEHGRKDSKYMDRSSKPLMDRESKQNPMESSNSGAGKNLMDVSNYTNDGGNKHATMDGSLHTDGKNSTGGRSHEALFF